MTREAVEIRAGLWRPVASPSVHIRGPSDGISTTDGISIREA